MTLIEDVVECVHNVSCSLAVFAAVVTQLIQALPAVLDSAKDILIICSLIYYIRIGSVVAGIEVRFGKFYLWRRAQLQRHFRRILSI